HVVGRVLHAHALQPRVPVVHVDELRTALVRARGDRACQLLLAEPAAQVEDLAGLDVDAEVDDQVGVALETVLHGKAMLTGARSLARAGTARNRPFPRLPAARRSDAALVSRGRRGVRAVARRPQAEGRGRRRARADGLRRRARPRAAAQTGAGDDRAEDRRRPKLPSLHARADEGSGRAPDAAPATAPPRHAEAGGGRGRARVARRRGAARAAEPGARRARLLRRPARVGSRRARPRGRRLRPRAASRARQGREGAHRPARRGGRASAGALSARGAAAARPRRSERRLRLGPRQAPRHLDAPPRLRASPPVAARVCDAPARGWRRPAHDPGAARPQLPLDDAAVQPRRRKEAAPCLRPSAPAQLIRPTRKSSHFRHRRDTKGQTLRFGRRTCRTCRERSRMRDPEVEGFLALLATRRAPKTVEAYRRDLSALADWLEGPVSAVKTEQLERYLAELRAAGLSPATIARRVAAFRSFFRHQTLLGARTDNPAAELDLPRRRRTLP